eukprot:XP_019929739.1 PREDICTED: uncharacterized protein LOC105345467 [Crassostrea gigas]
MLNSKRDIFQTMAIVYEFIIIYFALLINKSMSSFINRDLCFETGARFRDYQRKCLFNSSTAENILQDVTTCPNKCNFQIDHLHPYSNSLREINLTIGNGRKMFHSCPRSYYYTDVYLNINCSSWNAREYIIWDDVYACSINNAQCIHINNYCVCHCMPGYILEDETCLKMNVSIGGICEFDWQCNGTQFANVCDHGSCSCSPGYIQINRKCFMYNGPHLAGALAKVFPECLLLYLGSSPCPSLYKRGGRKTASS